MRETCQTATDVETGPPARERWTVRRCAFVVLGLSALFWLALTVFFFS